MSFREFLEESKITSDFDKSLSDLIDREFGTKADKEDFEKMVQIRKGIKELFRKHIAPKMKEAVELRKKYDLKT